MLGSVWQLKRVAKSGERPDNAKARSEGRDSTYTYSEARARGALSRRTLMWAKRTLSEAAFA